MASTIPAFRGSFGNTEFFVLTMKAGEFVRSVTIPKELEEWEDLNPEERFQREINYKRVATHIAPYFAHDEDRFIGAFIVEVRNDDEMEFESLIDAGVKFPKGFGNAMNPFGVLYLSGSEIMVPLDGQHRLAALDFAISGKNEKKQDIKGLEPNPQVANDSCTVILVRHDLEKSRKIFNKVNKNAKPTTKADNLITDDENYIAVISREDVVHNEMIPPRVVNTTSNTLSKAAGQFTTLSTIYEINYKIQDAYTGTRPNITVLPGKSDMALARQNITEFWKAFLKLEPFAQSLADTSEEGDKKRADIRLGSLACKPIVQQILADVVLEFQKIEDGAKEVSAQGIEEVVTKLNRVDWDPENPIWIGVLLQRKDKIIAGAAAATFARRVISYMLGEKLEARELVSLRDTFDTMTDGKPFPDPLF